MSLAIVEQEEGYDGNLLAAADCSSLQDSHADNTAFSINSMQNNKNVFITSLRSSSSPSTTAATTTTLSPVPRFVSFEIMNNGSSNGSTMDTTDVTTSKNTPFDVAMDLQRLQASFNRQQRFSKQNQQQNSSGSCMMRVASIFNQPSMFMQQQQQQILQQQQQRDLNAYPFVTENRLKRRRLCGNESRNDSTTNNAFITSSSSSLQASPLTIPPTQTRKTQPKPPPLLHLACRRSREDINIFPVVEGIIRDDSTAAGRREVLWVTKSMYDIPTQQVINRSIRETYSYPLNLAIQYGAPDTVIEALVTAAPHVLAMQDGSEQEGSLHVMLKYNNNRSDDDNYDAVVDMMMLQEPSICSMTDRRGNTPLHIACIHGASIDIIRNLCSVYPEALHRRNFHGLTPHQTTQRFPGLSSNGDEIAAYLLYTQLETHQ